jgi:hypothetical protein
MYKTDDLFFVVHYYNEPIELLTFCLKEFRRFYPDTALTLISDGENDHSEALGVLSNEFKLTLIQGEYLKAFDNGGLWTDRYFRLFLNSEKKLLCRFDPDTVWWRSINFDRYEPEFYQNVDWFGTMSYPYQRIRGACSFYTRDCVDKVLQSGMLSDLSQWNHDFYSREHQARDLSTTSEALQDRIMEAIALKLGLVVKEFNEVMILQAPNVNTNDYRVFAATHPHKNAHQDLLIVRWKAMLNPYSLVSQ